MKYFGYQIERSMMDFANYINTFRKCLIIDLTPDRYKELFTFTHT